VLLSLSAVYSLYISSTYYVARATSPVNGDRENHCLALVVRDASP
jgi:hypothetical protein